MNLRQASILEFDLVYNILYENAIWIQSKGVFQWPIDWLESIRPEIKASIDSGLFYVIELDRKLVATVELRSNPEEIWKNDQAKALYIHKLAICRKYSDKDLGREFLTLIKSKAKDNNINYLRLDCVAHNHRLREYYESCEFELKGIVETTEVNLALYEHQIQSQKDAVKDHNPPIKTGLKPS